MSKRKLPSTSLEANDSVTVEMRNNHYEKIVDALKVLGSANADTIANFAGFKNPIQVARRLTNEEMIGAKLVWRTEIQTKTSSGRWAFNYQLFGTSLIEVEGARVVKEKDNATTTAKSKTITSVPADKVFVDHYLRAKPNKKQPEQTQPNLFDLINNQNEINNQ